MRCFASATRSRIPGTGWSIERVAMSPSIHGIFTSSRVLRAAGSGSPNNVNEAGAGSVCHMLSIAAIFIFWCSVSM